MILLIFHLCFGDGNFRFSLILEIFLIFWNLSLDSYKIDSYKKSVYCKERKKEKKYVPNENSITIAILSKSITPLVMCSITKKR